MSDVFYCDEFNDHDLDNGKTPLNPSYGLGDKGRHRNRGLFRLHGIGNQNRKNMN